MNYETVRVYCGWPSREALRKGRPALDAFPCGWRTLVVRKGRKWVTAFSPHTLQKEKIKRDRWERDVQPIPFPINQKELSIILLTKLRQLAKKPDNFINGWLEQVSKETNIDRSELALAA